MTEDEKELEQKIKQYQYEEEENRKKLETLSNDLNKHNKKKSFIYKANRTVGRIIFVWSGLGFVIVALLLIWALVNLINAFNAFDPVKYVENKYNINLETISRKAENKVLTYKVKPKEWKYRKVEFTIVREGRDHTYDDFDTNCLRYIVQNIEQTKLLDDFEFQENYNEKNLLTYKLLYKGNSEDSIQKIQDLKRYILNFDKDIDKIIKVDEFIQVEKNKNKGFPILYFQ